VTHQLPLRPSVFALGVPPIAASGMPGYVSDFLPSVFARSGTPAAIVRRFNGEIARYFARQW